LRSLSRSGGNVGGIGLELVINNDGTDLKTKFREFLSRRPRESQGIPSTAQGNEIEPIGRVITGLRPLPNSTSGVGHGRRQPWTSL
jgi:hypothetical protein